MTIKNDLILIRKQLSKLLFKFSEIVSNEGSVIIYDGELAEGSEVYTYDPSGAKTKLPDGTYNLILDDIKKVVIETVDGIVKVFTVLEDMPKPIEESKEDAPLEMSVIVNQLKDEFKSEIDKMEVKLNTVIESLSKINDAVLSFGSETTTTPIKTIKVEDSIVGKTPASKYFQK